MIEWTYKKNPAMTHLKGSRPSSHHIHPRVSMTPEMVDWMFKKPPMTRLQGSRHSSHHIHTRVSLTSEMVDWTLQKLNGLLTM